MTQIPIAAVVPGGIRPGDHLHRRTWDDTCSRCAREMEWGEVPLLLWLNGGEDLYAFCETCLGEAGGRSLR